MKVFVLLCALTGCASGTGVQAPVTSGDKWQCPGEGLDCPYWDDSRPESEAWECETDDECEALAYRIVDACRKGWIDSASQCQDAEQAKREIEAGYQPTDGN